MYMDDGSGLFPLSVEVFRIPADVLTVTWSILGGTCRDVWPQLHWPWVISVVTDMSVVNGLELDTKRK